MRENGRRTPKYRAESRGIGGIVVNALLIVCIIFLMVAFVTMAKELGAVRRVLHEQGRHMDTLNHVDAIQSRQLQMHREDIDALKPPPPNEFVNAPARPAYQVKREQNGARPAQQDHKLRD
jgi:hypothetical protein